MRKTKKGGRSWTRLFLQRGACYIGWRPFRLIRTSDIRGQVVLITGGWRGLGLELARQFAREGCPLAICARDQQELERASFKGKAQQEYAWFSAGDSLVLTSTSAERAARRIIGSARRREGEVAAGRRLEETARRFNQYEHRTS
jgi:NAD(P)-dependent dehydrogenase (short-subunit alcohol dehydrogenase family)